MKHTLYIYSQAPLFEIINEILVDFIVVPLTLDEAGNHKFKNNNTLLVLKNDIPKEINKSFFSNNNVVVFFSNKHKFNDTIKAHNVNFFYGHSNVKKFLDEINTTFISKTLILKNIEILDEKISNINSGESMLLTPLEKEILIVLFEKKQITREFLLEEILKIKKKHRNKNYKSHLTRIRRKLLKIESEIQISSKEDVFFLEN